MAGTRKCAKLIVLDFRGKLLLWYIWGNWVIFELKNNTVFTFLQIFS